VFPSSFSSSFTPDQRVFPFQFDRRCLDYLYERTQVYVRRQGATGRLRAATILGDLQNDASRAISAKSGDYGVGAATVRLRAAAVALPAVAGRVELLALLPAELRARYSGPEGLLRDPATVEQARQRGVPAAQRAEYGALLRRLRSAGMVGVTANPACTNGVFTVAKGPDAQRLIIDCRPCNALMVDSPYVALPTPDVLGSLEVPRGATLFTAKLDVSNYYHQFRVPEWLQRYFALPPVRASEMGLTAAEGYAPDSLVHPCCLTLPMGWSHSVFLAQEIQLGLLRRSFSEEQLIVPGSSVEVSSLRVGAYIDDCFFLDVDAQRCQAAADRHEAVLQLEQLPVPPDKRQAATADPTNLIGIELDGRSLHFGLSPAKLSELVATTEAVLQRRRVGRETFERLLGMWTWAVLPRRPAFATLHSAYGFQQRLAAEGGQRTIWRSVERELQVLAGLAPLLGSQLNADWSPFVLATDASSSGYGAAMGRAARGTVQRMGRQAGAASLPTAGTVDQRRAAGLGPLRGVRWRSVISAPWQRSEHVNVLEGRALVTGVRFAVGNRNLHGQRVLALVDSTVIVAAASKGRSSSFRLLRPLRILAALCLAANVHLYCFWVPTASNPADLPSRFFQNHGAAALCV
jgi:hypothetical protein